MAFLVLLSRCVFLRRILENGQPTGADCAIGKNVPGYWTVTLDDFDPCTCHLYILGESIEISDPESNLKPQRLSAPLEIVEHKLFQWEGSGF